MAPGGSGGLGGDEGVGGRGPLRAGCPVQGLGGGARRRPGLLPPGGARGWPEHEPGRAHPDLDAPAQGRGPGHGGGAEPGAVGGPEVLDRGRPVDRHDQLGVARGDGGVGQQDPGAGPARLRATHPPGTGDEVVAGAGVAPGGDRQGGDQAVGRWWWPHGPVRGAIRRTRRSGQGCAVTDSCPVERRGHGHQATVDEQGPDRRVGLEGFDQVRHRGIRIGGHHDEVAVVVFDEVADAHELAPGWEPAVRAVGRCRSSSRDECAVAARPRTRDRERPHLAAIASKHG